VAWGDLVKQWIRNRCIQNTT